MPELTNTLPTMSGRLSSVVSTQGSISTMPYCPVSVTLCVKNLNVPPLPGWIGTLPVRLHPSGLCDCDNRFRMNSVHQVFYRIILICEKLKLLSSYRNGCSRYVHNPMSSTPITHITANKSCIYWYPGNFSEESLVGKLLPSTMKNR